VRELRDVPRATAAAVAAESASAAASRCRPTGVSADADARCWNESRVGDARDAALARLDQTVHLAQAEQERGPLGAREVRAYQLAGYEVILVFEPFERRGAPRLAAIYLQ